MKPNNRYVCKVCKVGHRRLLKKLEHYGIRGPTNRWINSFLSKRTQTVVFEGSSSYTAPIKSGVPQGSVLGPCMFLFFMNDLPDALTSQVRLFADDTLVYLTVNTQDDAHRLQADLNKLAEWGQRWLMEFNAKKCQVLRVTRRRHIVEHQYTLHGKELETCTSAKYLGITISSYLRWNKHVDEVCSKANKTLGFLRRNLRVSSPKLKTLAYFSLVRPLVEYAAPAWDPHTDRNINKLQKVQRRAARFVCNRYNNNTSSVSDMIKHLQWSSLQQRREILRLVLLYKIHHKLVHFDTSSYLTPTHGKAHHIVTCPRIPDSIQP